MKLIKEAKRLQELAGINEIKIQPPRTRVVDINTTSDPIPLIIDSKIEGRISGDWNLYDEGEEVRYDFDLGDEDEFEEFSDRNITLNDVKKYIGKNIRLYYDENIWYDVSIENNTMFVDWVYERM